VGWLAFVPEASEPLPALYLLHGAGGSHLSWRGELAELLLELAAEHRLVVVAPNGTSHGWYLDSPLDPTRAIETWFVAELIPQLEASELPIQPGRRSVTGFSMGGHGALVLALRNPGTFASASSISGIVDPLRHPRSWGLPAALGPLTEATRPRWEAHSTTHLLSRPDPPLPSGGILFTVGDSDQAATAENRELHELLEERGVPHRWTESEGGHDGRYLRGALPEHVRFHAEALAAAE